jgi:phage-related protein
LFEFCKINKQPVTYLANFVMGEKNRHFQIYREVIYYEDHYLIFFETLTPSVQKKFNWTLLLIATLERVPEKYLKHLTGSNGLYEVRVESGSDIYRVFCFFDEGKLIILLHGFQKKTWKTPRKEMAKAQRLKEKYEHEKER